MEVDLASVTPPPESPSEELVAEEPVVDDSDVKRLGLHPDLADDPAFHNTVAQAQLGVPQAGSVASNDVIANLLGQLAPPDAGTPQHHHEAPPPVAFDPAALEQLRHFEPAQIAQIVANTPQFQNLDLSALGVGQPVPNQFPYAGAGYPPVQVRCLVSFVLFFPGYANVVRTRAAAIPGLCAAASWIPGVGSSATAAAAEQLQRLSTSRAASTAAAAAVRVWPTASAGAESAEAPELPDAAVQVLPDAERLRLGRPVSFLASVALSPASPSHSRLLLPRWRCFARFEKSENRRRKLVLYHV